MKGVVVGIVVHFLVSGIVEAGQAVEGTKIKAEYHAAVEKAVPNKFVDKAVEALGDEVIDKTLALLQDKPDLTAALTALGNHDMVAARKALVALVKPLVGAELGKLLEDAVA